MLRMVDLEEEKFAASRVEEQEGQRCLEAARGVMRQGGQGEGGRQGGQGEGGAGSRSRRSITRKQVEDFILTTAQYFSSRDYCICSTCDQVFMIMNYTHVL